MSMLEWCKLGMTWIARTCLWPQTLTLMDMLYTLQSEATNQNSQAEQRRVLLLLLTLCTSCSNDLQCSAAALPLI